jgi:DNA-binding CsgD family transcriptional regulator/tetratricopeptide (TPR) repeat protein
MHETLLDPLTPRERDILQGMVEGLSNAEIAARLVLSAETVKWYVKQLYGKLDAHSRDEAIARALALELVVDLHAEKSTPDRLCPLINPLPQDVSDRYVGNAAVLAHIINLLHQRVRLISIYGRAGAGKTALACQALSDLRQADRDARSLTGIVCLSAIGASLTLDRVIADVSRVFANHVQIALDAMAQNAELPSAQKIKLMLEKIADQRIVVLLDNLETMQDPASGALVEAGLQQLIELSIAQSSALTFVLTSREPLALPRTLKTWEHLISLEDGLPLDDAVMFLRRFDPSGAAGLRDAGAAELREVTEQVGGFPRALESIAGMLLEDPLLRLADVKHNVTLLHGEISAAVVQQALAHLNAEAMCVLEALAIFEEPVSYEALAYVLTPYLPDATVRARLGRLNRACFVKVNRATQEFALHPIDQAYCYNQIPLGEGDEPAAFTRAVLHRRAAQHYHALRTPRSTWRRVADLQPQLHEIKHLIRAGDGDEAARVVLDIDREVLWEWGHKDLLRQLYTALDGLLRDPLVVHHVARRRAWLNFFEAPSEADQEFARLLAEAHRLGRAQEEADALDDLAQTCRRGNADLDRAVEYHRQALTLYRQIGDRRGEAEALGGLGSIKAFFEPEDAIDHLQAAITIQRELGNSNSLSYDLSMLATAYETLGAYEQAQQALNEALQIARAGGTLEALNRVYGTLARVYAKMGELDRVKTCVQEAIAATRESAGVSITGSLAFVIGWAAIYLTVANDAPSGIELMEQTIQDAAVVQPQLAPMGNFALSSVLLLSGDLARARQVLPPEPQRIAAIMGVGNSYWIGVLLIKTGEHDRATIFFDSVLKLSRHAELSTDKVHYSDIGTLPARVLALAGLALLKRDPALAASAAQLLRKALRFNVWFNDLLRAHLNLLLPEPGSEVLAPIRDILMSNRDNALQSR